MTNTIRKTLENITLEEARQRLTLCESTLALSEKKITALCNHLRAQHASPEAIHFAETALTIRKMNKTRE